MPLHIETPLLQSRHLSQLSGRAVWLKMDALQAPGSFKIRGVGHACTEYVNRGARRLVSSSGGNAGLAVAYAGRSMGVPVTVVVPQTTSERAKELLRLEDAEVIVHGASWHVRRLRVLLVMPVPVAREVLNANQTVDARTLLPMSQTHTNHGADLVRAPLARMAVCAMSDSGGREPSLRGRGASDWMFLS